jgi:hypothetical protein
MAYEVTTSIERTATPENVWAVLAGSGRLPAVASRIPVGNRTTRCWQQADNRDYRSVDR